MIAEGMRRESPGNTKGLRMGLGIEMEYNGTIKGRQRKHKGDTNGIQSIAIGMQKEHGRNAKDLRREFRGNARGTV